MKKLISLFLLLALLLSIVPAAYAAEGQLSNQTLLIDGKAAPSSAYNIGGYNYFRLRELAALLKDTESRFAVRWDQENRRVEITTGKAYVPDGGESIAPPQNPVIVRSSQSVWIDGKPAPGLSAYNINGSNYFKLADLARYLGFSLSYDPTNRLISLTTGKASPLVFAADYAEVARALSASRNGMRGNYDMAEEAAEPEVAMEEPMAVPTENASSDSGAAVGGKGADEAFSGTNVQVAGIDEGDIVKTDGKYLYVLDSDMNLTVISAAGENSTIVSRTEMGFSDWEDNGKDEDYDYVSTNKYPQEMFIFGDRLAVISNYSYFHEYEENDRWNYESENYTALEVLDVSDPTEPVVIESEGQDGWLLSSRMMDGKLYLVTNYYVYSFDEGDVETYIPRFYNEEGVRPIAAGDICIASESDEYVVVSAYDMEDGSLLKAQSLLGAGDQIYMSADNLYVFGSVWGSESENVYQESVYTVTEYRNSTDTQIHRFDLTENGLSLAAAGTVPGYMDSQFSADEFNGTLRVVTTRNENSYKIYEDETYGFSNYVWGDDLQSTGLYILDEDLDILGSVEDLAPDERVYSARFDGDIAYFCTFRQVDPLFAVDLSDPSSPTVLSALKIPGFSEYLHSWGEGRLFGFGRDADEETGSTGNLKLVMFDTSDKTDVRVENSLMLDSWYSEALYNHKAIFISPEKNLIGFVGDGDYYLFSYDPAKGFSELTHFEFDSYEYDMRGFYIGNCVYLASPSQALVLDMNGWKQIKQIRITEEEQYVIYDDAAY